MVNFFKLLNNDSNFAKEIYKILLDKGLLAIIFVAVSYQVSKLLERYKTKNAFSLSLLAFRVKAYSDIFECLMKHTVSKESHINALRGLKFNRGFSSEGDSFIAQENAKRIDEAEKELKRSSNEFAGGLLKLHELLTKNSLFISEDFFKKLNEYISSMQLNPLISPDIDTLIERINNLDSRVKLIQLQDLIVKEIGEKRKKPLN